MDPTRLPSDPLTIDKMSPGELAALVEDARTLQRAAETGTTQPLLRGRKFGLLCAAGGTGKDDIALFDLAAIELGAQVAHIRPNLTELSEPQEVEHTAHMLGRLYDAVVCQDMAPPLVRRLSAIAGIPVYDRITSSTHPFAKTADTLDPEIFTADNRRFLVQALLVKTIA